MIFAGAACATFSFAISSSLARTSSALATFSKIFASSGRFPLHQTTMTQLPKTVGVPVHFRLKCQVDHADRVVLRAKGLTSWRCRTPSKLEKLTSAPDKKPKPAGTKRVSRTRGLLKEDTHINMIVRRTVSYCDDPKSCEWHASHYSFLS